MLKNNNYILTIMLYPFLLLLSFLVLRGSLTGYLYRYLVIIMIIVFIPSFIMSLYGVVEDILNSKNKWRLILLIIFPFFYFPIYYTWHITKTEKYLGIIICLLNIVVSYFTFNAFNNKLYNWVMKAYQNYVVVNDNYVYTSANNLFSINVSKDFRCSSRDIGDYVIFCDRLDDDSFIGIYSYDITGYYEEEVADILSFHLKQSKDYVQESGYESQINYYDDVIEINYHDMVILLSQNNYVIDDNTYSLIIIKEMPKDMESIDDFKKMIETIYFLNYNEEVSS